MFESPSLSLPVLGEGNQATSTSPQLETLRRRLADLDQDAAVDWFELDEFDRLLKTTISLCPDCLRHVPAIVFTRRERVWMRKRCPDHGPGEAILENDERFYFLSNKDCSGRRFAEDRVLTFPLFDGGCCGDRNCGASVADPGTGSSDFTDQSGNKSCTILVEVTNACNLSCRVCYSDARGDRILPLDRFERYMLRLIQQHGTLDSVQLTGGEAILHPQFWEMVAFLHAQDGIGKIYLPTNGILFARRENAERLVPFRDKLMVLLQFDGRRADANLSLRNADPTRIRQQVIDHLGELDIVMQLTMTLTRSVNDDEVGWVIDTAMKNPHIKLAALQPVTYSGRYDLPQEAVDRLTLSDVVKAVVGQANRRMRTDDFVPIPCSHPNCGWLTLFVRRCGLTLNVARHIDLAKVTERVAYKTVLSTGEIREMVGQSRPSLFSRIVGGIGRRIVRPTDLFGIAIKPFMDRFNYDQDRIANCCHHLVDTHGQLTSFCEYNARLRETDPWDSLPVIDSARGIEV